MKTPSQWHVCILGSSKQEAGFSHQFLLFSYDVWLVFFLKISCNLSCRSIINCFNALWYKGQRVLRFVTKYNKKFILICRNYINLSAVDFVDKSRITWLRQFIECLHEVTLHFEIMDYKVKHEFLFLEIVVLELIYLTNRWHLSKFLNDNFDIVLLTFVVVLTQKSRNYQL